jgi:hypothetical protein
MAELASSEVSILREEERGIVRSELWVQIFQLGDRRVLTLFGPRGKKVLVRAIALRGVR